MIAPNQKFSLEVQQRFSMQEDLRQLDVDTFEIEDLADLGQEAAAAIAPANRGGCTSCCSSCCSSCSTSSCSTCSTSCSS